MTNKEFMDLKNYEVERETVLSVNDLINKEDRTLLYGYTHERRTWHVYLKDGIIHTVVYDNNYIKNIPAYLEEINVFNNEGFVPDKRLYPSACDYEFCLLLKKKGIYLPFTVEDDRKQSMYYGYTLEDVVLKCVRCKGNKNPYEFCTECKKKR